MNRRGLLKLLGMGTAGAAAAPKVTISQAAALVGASTAPPPGGSISVGAGYNPPEESLGWKALDRALVRAANRVSPNRYDAMPEHISGRKSWSPAFKVAVWNHEREILMELQHRIGRDKVFRAKVLSALGLPESILLDDGADADGWP